MFFFVNNRPDDVNALMSVKLALKYSGRDVEAMKAIAQASKKRSLADFQQIRFRNLIEKETNKLHHKLMYINVGAKRL